MGDMAYFPAYFSYARTLEGLTDEQFGHVMRAAIQYAENGTIPELSALEKMGFAFIKEDIDRANERYQKVCETNKRNIQKRWTKKQPEEPVEHPDGDAVTDTTVYGRMDAIPDHTTVYETYQSKSNSNSKRKAKENANAIATATTTDAGGARVVGGGGEKKNGFDVPSVSDVAGYCVKQGYTHVDVEEFVKFYDGNGWTVGDGEPMKSWKAVLRGWEERARKKPKPSAPADSSFDTDDFFDAALQRTYGDNWQFFKQGAET